MIDLDDNDKISKKEFSDWLKSIIKTEQLDSKETGIIFD